MKTVFKSDKKEQAASAREAGRVEAVNNLKHMDFDLNIGLQGIVKLAAEICDTPIALITLLDQTNQYAKVRHGADLCMIDRESSFCTYTIEQYDVMVVEDMMADQRFSSNPFVTDGPMIRFYAGAPLTTMDELNLGALCVLDVNPKVLTEGKKHLLKILADQALYLMQLQHSMELLQKQVADIEKQNKALSKIAFIQSHEFRSPVATILGLMNLIKDEGYSNSEDYFLMMEDAVKFLDKKIHMVVASTSIAKRAHVA